MMVKGTVSRDFRPFFARKLHYINRKIGIAKFFNLRNDIREKPFLPVHMGPSLNLLSTKKIMVENLVTLSLNLFILNFYTALSQTLNSASAVLSKWPMSHVL